mmetsp:Transcript_21418/g.33515  ORF Transcript_21418/g.33515 Transcript_21418/m.33515 type:complete len:101 (-) Transcript_21418:483-785(-)
MFQTHQLWTPTYPAGACRMTSRPNLSQFLRQHRRGPNQDRLIQSPTSARSVKKGQAEDGGERFPAHMSSMKNASIPGSSNNRAAQSAEQRLNQLATATEG